MRPQSARPAHQGPSGVFTGIDEGSTSAGNLHLAAPTNGSRAILDSLQGSHAKPPKASSALRTSDARPSSASGKHVSIAQQQSEKTRPASSSRGFASDRNDALRSSAPVGRPSGSRPGSARSQASQSQSLRHSTAPTSALRQSSAAPTRERNSERPASGGPRRERNTERPASAGPSSQGRGALAGELSARSSVTRSSITRSSGDLRALEDLHKGRRTTSFVTDEHEMGHHRRSDKLKVPTPSRIVTTNRVLGPMDFSAFEMDDVEDLPSLSTAPNTSPGKQRPLPNDQYSGFLLGHNNLKSIKSLPKVAEQLLVNPPEQVQWLDLSYNEFTKIDEAVFDFPNISVLYLHGNNIASLDEVKKLKRLPKLRKLTLNGNPMAELPTYRKTITTQLPQLRVLDFAGFTLMERETAQIWKDSISGVFKPKLKEKVY